MKLVEYGNISCINNAKKAWAELDSPFILKLFNYFEDHNYIYFLLELNIGYVDLYKRLHDSNQIPETHSKFYAASIILALNEMHSKKIACRDLRVSLI